MEMPPYIDMRLSAAFARAKLNDFVLVRKLNNLVSVNGVTLSVKMQIDNLSRMLKEYDELQRVRKQDITKKQRAEVANTQDAIRSDYDVTQLTDGTIVTSTFFYKLARDIQNGKYNLFRSHSAEYLKAKLNPETDVREFIDNDFRYQVATYPERPTVTQIEETVSKDHFATRKFGDFKMSSYGGSFFDHMGREVYAFTNDRYSICAEKIPKEDGGGWLVKICDPIDFRDGEKRFTPFDTMAPKYATMKSILSNGIPYETYKTKAEALAAVRMLYNKQSQLVWQGKDPNRIKTRTKRNIIKHATRLSTRSYSFLSREYLDVENKYEAIHDIVKTLATAAVAGTLFSLSFPFAVVFAIASNYSDRKTLSTSIERLKRLRYWLSKNPSIYFGERGEYVANFKENMGRQINAKPNVEKNSVLDVLDGKDFDITPISKKQKKTMPNRARVERNAADGMARPEQVSNIAPATIIESYTNGHTRFYHRDTETDRHTVFHTYIPVLDNNDRISLSPAAKKDLLNGKIVRSVHEKGKLLPTDSHVTFEEMRAEVMELIEEDYATLTAVNKRRIDKSLEGFFNSKAIGEIDDDDKRDINPPKVSKADKRNALEKLFNNPELEIEEAPPELVAFYRGIDFPSQSCILH
jgi:hypothetical protein